MLSVRRKDTADNVASVSSSQQQREAKQAVASNQDKDTDTVLLHHWPPALTHSHGGRLVKGGQGKEVTGFMRNVVLI